MSTLTNREREIVTLLGRGMSPSQIAEMLCLARETVWYYTRIARQKVGASSTIDLAVKAALHNSPH